jgi:transcriptional regulator NrdR family protein
MYKVQKKDGHLEDFDRSKIIDGLVRAGTTVKEAEKVATDIDAWLPTIAVDNIVNSLDIRVKGLDLLKIVNPKIAARFEDYQKPTE